VGFGLALAALCVALTASSASAVGPYPDLGPCQVFPDPPASLSPRAPSLPTEAAWNQDISKAPRHPRSAAYIAYINAHGGDSLHPDFGSPRAYGFPYSVVGAGQPKLPIHYTAYGDESDPGPFPVPARAPVEGGNGSDGDRHVIVIDRSACKLYELYRAFPVAKPQPHWNADAGTEWDLRSTARRPEGWTSADAAAPPMGLRLRLKAGYGLGGFGGPAKAIAEAMKRYGLIVADNGSNWYFSGSSDRRWDDENLNQLKRIPGGAFEVVKSAASPHACK
jgi:hypothetical protein